MFNAQESNNYKGHFSTDKTIKSEPEQLRCDLQSG